MKKIITLIMVVLLCFTGLTACSSTTDDDSTSGEAIEIVLWHTLTDHHLEALEAIIEAFNASQDAYVVVAEQQTYSEIDAKLLQAVRTGTGPDFVSMYASDAAAYIEDGFLYDLSVFINDEEIGIENYSEHLADGVYAEITQWGEDSIYLVPVLCTSEVLYYNKTMFDELGLSEPTTWEELEECAKAIYEAYGIAGFGSDSICDTFTGWLIQNGSSYIDTETTTVSIDEEIAITLLNWFANGVEEGYFRLVGDDYYFSSVFGSSAVGMYIGSSAGVDYALSAIPEEGEDGYFELGVCAVPQGENCFIPNWGSTYACLSTDDEHALGVYTFLKYMLSEEVLVEWAISYGAIPSMDYAVENETFQEYAATNLAVAALISEREYANYVPSIAGASTVRDEIDKLIETVALGLSDATTAYADFLEAANEALNDN